MISCTEFIPAYSELFRFLEQQGGFERVCAYWEYIAANGLKTLETLVQEKGIRGCYEYWSQTLNEEAADFTMTLDEEHGLFRIDMRYCPSKGRLLQYEHIEPYAKYCLHCGVLYRRVLEQLGFVYEYDFSRCDQASCSLTVRQA